MFQHLLQTTVEELYRAKAARVLEDFVLIGGLAVSAWGSPRATADIHFAVKVADPKGLTSFLSQCSYLAGEPRDPLDGVFRLHGDAVQLVCFPPKLTQLVFSDPVEVTLDAITIPVISLESLIIIKLYAGGPQDLLDVQSLVAKVSGDSKRLESLKSLAARYGLSL